MEAPVTLPLERPASADLDISQKVLTQQLRELEDDGIIDRQVQGDRAPFKVVYSLTETGRSLGKILLQMSLWGERRADELPDVEIENDHAGFDHLLETT